MLTRRSSELGRAAVDERHQPEADGQLQRVDADLCQRLPPARRQRGRGGGCRGVGVPRGGHAVAHGPGDRAEDRGDQQERELRQARDQREQADRAGGHERRLALAEDLPAMSLPRSLSEAARVTMMPVATEISSAGICADQAVADGQQGVLVGGFAEAQVVLEHAHDDPADEVDRGDDQGGHGVAFDELGGAVHGAVEVGLAGDLGRGARACSSLIRPALRSA